MKSLKRFSIVTLGIIALIGAIGYAQTDLSGNEILARVDEQSQFLSKGSMIITLQFDNQYADGTTSENRFAGLSKQVEGGEEYSLIYFVEPEDVSGTLFLSVKVSEGEGARTWLYLPWSEEQGILKELVAEKQKQSFAGSTFSYQDVGSREIVDKYDAELIGEDTLTVDGEEHVAYVLALTAKPDADTDYPGGKMWVDENTWLMLKNEDYNETGNLEKTMEVLKLGEFEGNATADQIIAKDVLEGSSTTITFWERRRPDEEISDDTFDAENLDSFDPTVYGLID
ncbi:TPA: hypothetical protein DIT45_02595 [Candidatus Acetothermia bacterium]|nr:hypothetical protein [Candidatus Acetothermia bacterium]